MSTTKAERARIDHVPNINPSPRKMRVDAMLPKASTDILRTISQETGKSHSQLIEEALWLYEQAWKAQQAGGETTVDLGDGIVQSVFIS